MIADSKLLQNLFYYNWNTMKRGANFKVKNECPKKDLHLFISAYCNSFSTPSLCPESIFWSGVGGINSFCGINSAFAF